MLDDLETLRVLQEERTTGRAAARLRVTQSAVSKRIASLEADLGLALVERVGRNIRLTPAAVALLSEATPLLAQLRDVLTGQKPLVAPLTLAATESILSSWLPALLRDVALPLQLHTHRGPGLLQRVTAGDYALGICVDAGLSSELEVVPLGEEPMVVVPTPDAAGPPWSVWTIEASSLTWQVLDRRIQRRNLPISVVGRLESFTALVQVARAGLASALVPLGVAKAMGVDAPIPVALSRPIALFGRRTTLARSEVQRLAQAIKAGTARTLVGTPDMY